MSFLKGGFDKLKDAAKSGVATAGEGLQALAETEQGQKMTGAAKDGAQALNDLADRTGAKAAYGTVSETVSDRFDSMSGEKVMQEMQRRLDGQDELNDALANRLHEALTRIESLERRLADAEVAP